jgi:16S rRNA (adenine1518-N6/adenine1519-N6)-dimethyltransferase
VTAGSLPRHVPRKRFGQHFLIDRSVIEAIVRAVAPREGDELLEIGPGQGALTDALLQRIGHLSAVEIDRDLARRLRARHPAGRLTLIEADALRFDYGRATGRWRLVGNLPYNISSPLLVHLVRFRGQVSDQHFMLQKEVVDRIVALPGTADYGRLTVLLQTYYAVQALFDVDAAAFDPPPRVTSAVLRMIPLGAAEEPPLAVMEALLAQAFAQRRKMLRNTLLPWLAARGIADSHLPPTARPEELPVADYVALARRLSISSIL